jgi:hypothetical protein
MLSRVLVLHIFVLVNALPSLAKSGLIGGFSPHADHLVAKILFNTDIQNTQ